MAIKEYREAVKLDPTFAPARTNLGVAYQEQGRLEMAIPQYREVIKLNPNDGVAHANLGCALAEQGKFEPALQSYKEALRLNPNDAEIHFAMGGVYETKGRMDLAIKEYREATTTNPELASGPHRAWLVVDGTIQTDGSDGCLQPRRESQSRGSSGPLRHRQNLCRPWQTGNRRREFSKAIRFEKDPAKKNAIMNALFSSGQTGIEGLR